MADVYYGDYNFQAPNRKGVIAKSGFDGVLDKIVNDNGTIKIYKGTKDSSGKTTYADMPSVVTEYDLNGTKAFNKRVDFDGDKLADKAFFASSLSGLSGLAIKVAATSNAKITAKLEAEGNGQIVLKSGQMNYGKVRSNYVLVSAAKP